MPCLLVFEKLNNILFKCYFSQPLNEPCNHFNFQVFRRNCDLRRHSLTHMQGMASYIDQLPPCTSPSHTHTGNTDNEEEEELVVDQ